MPPRAPRTKPAATGPMLTLDEVCAELQISRSTFHKWRAKKTGPHCVKLPNSELRIYRSTLDAWLAEHQDTA